MKKILAALLGLTLAFTLTACGGNDEPQEIIQENPSQTAQPSEDPALTALRQEIADSGSVCAVGYLGTLPPSGDVNELLANTDYPFLADTPVVPHAGSQVFCVIPPDDGTEMIVEEYLCDESNGYQGEVGVTLYVSPYGVPVILVCNENDVIPNLVVTLKGADGETVSYSPTLELCGGTVFVPAGMSILDISDYETVSQQAPPAPSVDFTGTWEAYEDFDGSQVVLKTTFGEDSSARYLCGYAYSEFLSDYQGSWYVLTDNGTSPAGSVVLEMKDAMSGDDFFGVYSVTAESGTITLTHLNGDSLLYGWEGKGITFPPATN